MAGRSMRVDHEMVAGEATIQGLKRERIFSNMMLRYPMKLNTVGWEECFLTISSCSLFIKESGGGRSPGAVWNLFEISLCWSLNHLFGMGSAFLFGMMNQALTKTSAIFEWDNEVADERSGKVV